MCKDRGRLVNKMRSIMEKARDCRPEMSQPSFVMPSPVPANVLTALMLGAPLYAFAGLPEIMAQHPKPAWAMRLKNLHMDLMTECDTYIKDHIPGVRTDQIGRRPVREQPA